MVTDNNIISKFKDYLNDPYVKLLLIILFIGFLLRVWGIWNIEHTDEFNEVFEALKVDSGRLNLERWNKKVLIYILAFEYGIYFLVGWVLGIFSSVSDFASKIAINMSPLFIIGRATSALFGTLIVAITYSIGSRLFNKQTGLIAALFLCFNYVHVEHSHLVLVDITMTLMVVSSFYFATLIMDNGKKSAYFLAGLFAGLAIVAKIPSVFILISIAAAHVLRFRDKSRSLKCFLIHGHILWLAVGLLLGAILGSPGILVGLPKFLKWLVTLLGAYSGTHDQIDYWTPINGHKFYIASICRNMGLPLFTLAVSGLIYFSIRRKREIVLILSFILPFYFFMGTSEWVLAGRYMIPIYPFLSIAAGATLSGIAGFAKSNRRLILFGMLLCALAFPIRDILLFELSLLQQNTRYLSKEWIEQNIPKGAKMLIDSGRTINTYSPPIFDNEENIRAKIRKIQSIASGETSDDSRIVDSRSSIYFQYLLENMPPVTYDLTSTEIGNAVKTLDYYRREGYNYIITSSAITWKLESPKWNQMYPVASEFYRSLGKELDIVKQFAPTITRSGPKIVIYKVE